MAVSSQLWIVVIIYIVLSIVAGNLSGRREKSAKGYFHSELPAIVVALSCTGAAISGVAFIGTPGTTYAQGLGVAAACGAGGVLGVVLANVLLGKPMRRLHNVCGSITITDLFVDAYQDKRFSYICIPVLLIVSTVFAAVQWQSIGTLLNTLLGIDYIKAVLLGVVVVTLYTILGGNKSTAVVGAVQVGVAMLACIYLVYAALKVSGTSITGLHEQVKAVDSSFLNMTNSGLSAGAVVSYILLYSLGSVGQPSIMVRYFQLKDPKLLPKTLAAGTISMTLTLLVPVVSLVMFLQVANGNIAPLASADACVPAFIGMFCGPFAGGLLVSACLAAIMSTAGALLISASSTLVKDIMVEWMHVDMSGRKGITYSRLATLLIIVVSTLIACFPSGGILQIGFAAFGAFGAVFAPSAVLTLRWRRCTKQGTFAGMVAAFVVVALQTILNATGLWHWPFTLHVGVVAMAINTIITVAVSFATPVQDKPFLPPTSAQIRAMQSAEAAAAE